MSAKGHVGRAGWGSLHSGHVDVGDAVVSTEECTVLPQRSLQKSGSARQCSLGTRTICQTKQD